MSQILLSAILLAQPEWRAPPAAAVEIVMAREPFREFPLHPAVRTGRSNTRLCIDELAQAAQTSPRLETGEPSKPPFEIARSATPIPEDLQAQYSKLVHAFRAGDSDKIQDLALPGSVWFKGGYPYNGYGSQELVSLNGEVNLEFARNSGPLGFSADVMTVTKHSDVAYRLRTPTSAMSFVKTPNSGWKLYAYFDRPIKYDEAAKKEQEKRAAVAPASQSVVLTPETMAAHGFHIKCEVFDQTEKIDSGRMPPAGSIRVSVHFDPMQGPAIISFQSGFDERAFLVVREGDAVLLSVPVQIKPWVGSEGGLYVRFSTRKDLLSKTQLVLDKDRLKDGLGSFTVDLKAFIEEK